MSLKKKVPAIAPQENVWPPPPPENEGEMEKAARLEEEREAKRVSDAIDRNLEAERQALRKRQKSEIKLLLLGVWPLSLRFSYPSRYSGALVCACAISRSSCQRPSRGVSQCVTRHPSPSFPGHPLPFDI